jgi:hypothetical protein
MAHDHHHSGESYYLDQLCTIGICAALGLVMFLLWYWGALYYLKSTFAVFVMLGGSALMILAAIRGVALWITVGRDKKKAAALHQHHHQHGHDHHHDGHDHEHCHDHHHGHEHDYEHHHHHKHEPAAAITEKPAAATGYSSVPLPIAHQHDHDDHGHAEASHYDEGHDHGWAPWRYAVLVLPIALFLLDVPPRSSSEDLADDGIPYLSYAKVEQAAKDPQARIDFDGKRTHLRGWFSAPATADPQHLKEFKLIRFRINCCAIDAVPVNLVVRVRPDETSISAEDYQGKWVDLTGQLAFEQVLDNFVTVLWLDKIEVREKPDARQYIE